MEDREEIEEIIQEDNSSDKKEKGESLLSWIMTLALYFAIALLLRHFVFNITMVKGSSMFPTLKDGDKLFTQKVSLYFQEPEKGDIVVLHAPDKSGDDYIKRVIAKAGDKVEIIDSKLYINGEKQDETYINGEMTNPIFTNQTEWTVPEGYLFVLGDNRGASNDSRAFGPIETESIAGISMFRLYPFDKFGSLK